MADSPRLRKKRQLQVCPVCAGYMNARGAIEGQHVGGRHWKDDTRHRSFGGKALREFVCEKCGHAETFQIDDLDGITEDE